MSDAEVIREVLAGRHESFEFLVRRYFGSIYALCLSYVRDATQAQDTAQETFVRCYKQLDSLHNPGRFAGWIASIARNMCVSQLRSDSRRKRLLTDFAENGVEVSNGQNAERRELCQAVRRKVDELPPKTREAIYLFYFEELSLKEIGELVGKSPNAVASLLKHGRRALKDKLWEEAADSLRIMRPKKDSIVKACAAIPFGSAPWIGKAGTRRHSRSWSRLGRRVLFAE
ncbi:RNA polymerase sigma factor [Candidatus Hydrogenedentota bacterium]